MKAQIPAGAPDPDDVSRGLAELERHLAQVTTADDIERKDAPSGETRRVRRLRAEVAEAHRLRELQADDTPLYVDSRRVRRRRRRVAEAHRLHQLAQDPRALAWQDQRIRRAATTAVMSAAGIALAVSSVGVQASVARALDLARGSLGWWAAWLVEPALSMPLLAAVGVQAYAAMRGHTVDRTSPAGRRLFRIEALLLALTLVLNCWPALRVDGFSALALIVHALGPIAAVTSVWTLPTIWAVMDSLGRLTAPTYSANAPADRVPGNPPARLDVAELTERARRLIATGQLPAEPSANAVRQALRCGMDTARAVRDALRADR